MISGYTDDCPLCRLVQNNEIKTELLFEDEIVLVTFCIVCRVPMAVLKAHRPDFNETEITRVKDIFLNLTKNGAMPIDRSVPLNRVAGGIFLSNNPPVIPWVIDFEQRKIPDHAHCHLRPHHFPGTTNWKKLR